MTEVVIAGYGETAFHKDDQRHPYVYLNEAVSEAVADAGIEYAEVDGLSVSSTTLHRDNATHLAQYLGISGRWLFGDLHGGADVVSGIARGAAAIEAGKAETVLVAAADTSTPDSHVERMGASNWGNYSYMRPYGFGGANGIMALIQRRHMHEHGTTREQLSHIAVTQREHARLNPKALLRDPLSKQDYLDARPIVEPIHLYDCVLPCGGGGAVVLTTAERAEALDAPAVHVLGKDEYHDPEPLDSFALTGRNRGLSYHTTLEQAGLEPWDVDVLELYDNYPIWVAMQLEDLGFCAEGEGGRFVSETDLSVTGELPLNTGGGQLSIGQPARVGGMVTAIEAVRQLRGEGDQRQVADCSTALVTGEGEMSYGGGLSTSSVALGAGPGVGA